MSISAFRDKFRHVLGVKEPPRKIATAFAVGVFIGMSPLLGVHTVLGILCAYAFRLNKFVTIAGVYVTNAVDDCSDLYLRHLDWGRACRRA